ncbi:MAG: 16S rRNA (adenine(1518)-N(6)/adenine(1519)-N(6))-dimethyltransferase RsmA, partial [Alphaproteobacteria bacterium]|nr:16S rRNA (adenine(1518)-N(6)/adenine(1519)-N(6))-dimethyltransferase RsmA [Alphaproteobacteria bacterium]
QHFLCDLLLMRKIVKLAGDLKGCSVIEIGAGPGGLTRALAESEAERVVVIEKDARFIPVIEEIAAAAKGKVSYVIEDALKTDMETIAAKPRAVVANLPYNVGSEILIRLLREIAKSWEAYRSITLMLQEEVVDRICAKPSKEAYGRLSIISQFYCETEKLMVVSPEAFTPPPKVKSAIVRLVPKSERMAGVSFEALEKVTASGFGQRRKMLRSSLKALGGEELLIKAGIEPTLRAENLSIEDFGKLTKLIGRTS